jgi:hypothetical protein
MGHITSPLPVTLFLAALITPRSPWEEVRARLEAQWGKIEFVYGPIDFTYSDYYDEEMGRPQQKIYMTFEKAIERDTLPQHKLFTNELEQRYAAGGKRSINCDPGYISRDKLVLASTKDFYHRLYLGEGIFGEVTLHFRKGDFQVFPWTYPDYQNKALWEMLIKVRAALVGRLRKEFPQNP